MMQQVVDPMLAQRLRCEKLAEYLWPAEQSSLEEMGPRLLLEHLLLAELEGNMVESVRTSA